MTNHLSLGVCLLLAAFAFQVQARDLQVVTSVSTYGYLRDGQLTGPGTRVVENTLEKASLDHYQMRVYPWARAYEKALHEPNVLIYPIIRTTAREPLFKWVGEIVQAQNLFYRLRGPGTVKASRLQDAKHYRIGVVRNDSRQAYLQDQGFTRLVVSSTSHESFQKLLNHQVQLLPMSEREIRLLSEEAGVDFSRFEAVATLDEIPVGIYIAFSLDTPDEVVAQARVAFDQLKASGEIERLMRQDP